MSSLKRQLDAQCEAQAAAQREASVWEAKASAAVALADRLEGDLAAVRHGACKGVLDISSLWLEASKGTSC